MISVWSGLKITCVIFIGLCLGNSSAEANESEIGEDMVEPSWWTSMFGVKPRALRADIQGGKEERFWATRGKRASLAIKPNGLFQPIKWKRANMMKPNGLFVIGKRSSLKPNSLFAMTNGKRSYMKPNGLFSTIESYSPKRSMSLKPNGLFALTKRSIDMDENVDFPYMNVPVISFEEAYNRHWGNPSGLFGADKRSMKPNGLFTLGKRSLDYEDYDLEEDNLEDSDLLEVMPIKRESQTFWATRGKRDADMFWATRGKRGENFWAVRG